ncbi:MAG: hypothetical protein JWN44_4342 [Myxococcales bacterium]|nr:hypothetical protein [Myxococcales bacterium]
MSARRQRFAVADAALVVALSRWLARARLPDDWDSVGFVRAVQRYDLAAFQPHFPGYPVYVALVRALHAALWPLGLSPLDAATAVSALASAATAVALHRIASSLGGARAGFVAMALWAAAWLPLMLGGSALSDATATAFAAAAFAALTVDDSRATLLGAAAVALCLGTRVSYWPLALSFAVVVARSRPHHRRAALVGGVVATAAWLLPFVAVVGARPLWALGTTHVIGHFSDWGGSVATRPDLVARIAAFARDLVFDGLFPHGVALVAAALAIASSLRRELRPPPSAPSAHRRAVAAIVLAPYAVWALLAQNVLEQPRHLLPLVAALVVGLAVITTRRLAAGTRRAVAAGAAVAVVALVAAAALAAVPLAVARVRVAPAAVQLARHVLAAHPAAHDAVIVGNRSVRLIHDAAPSLTTVERQTLDEVRGALERLDVLPPDLYVTSELTGAPDEAAHVTPGPEFCRDPRIDRQHPCLRLLRYNLQP